MGRGRRANPQWDLGKAKRVSEVFDQLRSKERSNGRLQTNDMAGKASGGMADATKEPTDTGETQ